jgi:hypothetical protein
MNIREAQDAIKAILAQIPDEELPEFDKVEIEDDGRLTVWWGSHGAILGSAKRGGERRPLNYRDNGAWAAVEAEMTYRADKRLLENGDDPTGIRLAKKAVSA